MLIYVIMSTQVRGWLTDLWSYQSLLKVGSPVHRYVYILAGLHTSGDLGDFLVSASLIGGDNRPELCPALHTGFKLSPHAYKCL